MATKHPDRKIPRPATRPLETLTKIAAQNPDGYFFKLYLLSRTVVRNDSYSLVVIANALKDAFGLESVNDLPIVYNIAWYEQKAVIVLLALLSVGVKNIHTGPTLPAFFTPEILKVLQEKFNIGTIATVDEDLATLIG